MDELSVIMFTMFTASQEKQNKNKQQPKNKIKQKHRWRRPLRQIIGT